ncbi:actin-domain-containing protein [Flagelloscypha sp. PMI_526]|nr:actin-domain-containing protein [Flagelloscypha sp. PMI_526]
MSSHSHPTIVLDNGGYTVKAGVVRNKRPVYPTPKVIQNAVIRSQGDNKTYLGHEFENCVDYSALHYRRPFDRGFIVDWDAQKAIWDGLFSEDMFNVDTTTASLLITEPYFNLPKAQEVYDQFVFEEYEFQAYHRATPASFIQYGTLFGRPRPDCSVIVDCGFSFTHVVPILRKDIQWSSIIRIDTGGKLLTNHLKEVTSLRQWDMLDQTYIVNEVKEACCYVSTAYQRDLDLCKSFKRTPLESPLIHRYVLPDLTKEKTGCVLTANDGPPEKEDAQILLMHHERFQTPELLFRPSDIGLDQAGIAESIARSISKQPEELQEMFWANIGVIGGSTEFPGFKERLMNELVSLAPMGCEVIVWASDTPTLEAFNSLQILAGSPSTLAPLLLTREQYLEHGSSSPPLAHTYWPDWKQIAASNDSNSAETMRVQAEEEEKERRKLLGVREDGKRTVGRPRKVPLTEDEIRQRELERERKEREKERRKDKEARKPSGSLKKGKRPVGRPRIHPLPSETPERPSVSVAASTSGKRGVGRPRKNPPPVEESPTAVVKRGVGRPRKNPPPDEGPKWAPVVIPVGKAGKHSEDEDEEDADLSVSRKRPRIRMKRKKPVNEDGMDVDT